MFLSQLFSKPSDLVHTNDIMSLRRHVHLLMFQSGLAQFRMGHAILFFSLILPSAAEDVAELNIHLYNPVGASPGTIQKAIREAAEVLATAGVTNVCWHILDDGVEAHIVDQSARPLAYRNGSVATD